MRQQSGSLKVGLKFRLTLHVDEEPQRAGTPPLAVSPLLFRLDLERVVDRTMNFLFNALYDCHGEFLLLKLISWINLSDDSSARRSLPKRLEAVRKGNRLPWLRCKLIANRAHLRRPRVSLDRSIVYTVDVPRHG